MHKIAILSDIHGNVTALEAVLADTEREQVTEYWVLGDLLMIGPGSTDLLRRLRELPNVTFVRGNWDDVFLDAATADFDDPTNVYGSRLAMYHYDQLSKEDIEFISQLPAVVTKELDGFKFLICHHLPTQNYGGELWPSAKQEHFDQLFADGEYNVAVYGHIHRQVMRYGLDGQLVVNPGSVHVPTLFSEWEIQNFSLQAQYAMIEIDGKEIRSVNFKKIAFDVDAEVALAKAQGLPYVDFYEEGLRFGRSVTHDKVTLARVNRERGYKDEVIAYFRSDQ